MGLKEAKKSKSKKKNDDISLQIWCVAVIDEDADDDDWRIYEQRTFKTKSKADNIRRQLSRDDYKEKKTVRVDFTL